MRSWLVQAGANKTRLLVMLKAEGGSRGPFLKALSGIATEMIWGLGFRGAMPAHDVI